MRIAIIGSGVAGMTAAWLLHAQHEITLFEAADYLGGHAHTVQVDCNGERHALDTGFIVYNERNYPHFTRLLAELDVGAQASDMSFSVCCQRTGLEYCGSSLNTLFAQRRNLLRPSFHRMLRDILRFNRAAPGLLAEPNDALTLGEYVRSLGLGTEFRDQYLLPMGAAIWSAPPEQMNDFPARYFVQFFHNHGLLSIDDRPQWRVITGGSFRYVERLTAPFADQIRLQTPIETITRHADHVRIKPVGHRAESFDQVVIATHGDQALRLLGDATRQEREILGSFASARNEAVLHTDETLLPRVRRAWASWNYHLAAEQRQVAVTYLLNRLQSIQSSTQFCVTLNRTAAIRPQRVLRRMTYDHPLYTTRSVAAQRRHAEISGARRTHFCGAYWGFGFHEDGVTSAIRVAQQLGVDWPACKVASTKDRSAIVASVR
jgi:predicted NAD/FAD-binding protein